MTVRDDSWDDDLDEANAELDGVAGEVQELAWALVDEQITPEQVKRLEELVIDDAEARQTYIQCMQLHADLKFFFAENQENPPADAPSPILGLPIDLPSLGADDLGRVT